MDAEHLTNDQKRDFVRAVLGFLQANPTLLSEARFEPAKNIPAIQKLLDEADAYAVANAAAIAELIKEQGRENIPAITLEGNKTEVDILYHTVRRLLNEVLLVAPEGEPTIESICELYATTDAPQ